PHNTPCPRHLSPLSLHDALPISLKPLPAATSNTATATARPTYSTVACPFVLVCISWRRVAMVRTGLLAMGNSFVGYRAGVARAADRKSTRLNSSHQIISYAVFCL